MRVRVRIIDCIGTSDSNVIVSDSVLVYRMTKIKNLTMSACALVR